MEKENSASGGGGGGGGAEATTAATPGATSTSEKLQADQANPLLDPTALFGGKSFSLVSLFFSLSLFFFFFLSPIFTSPISGVVMRIDEDKSEKKGFDDNRKGVFLRAFAWIYLFVE